MSCGTNAYYGLGHKCVDQKKRCKKFMYVNINEEGNKNKGNLRIKKIVSGNRHNLLLT